MTLTTHAVAGGMIASQVADPALGLSLALISHPILDLFPHWDLGIEWKKTNKIILFLSCMGDFFLGLALSYILFPNVNFYYLLAAVFISALPDALTAPYMFLKWNFPPFSWLWKFQSQILPQNPLPFIPGVLIQILALVILYILLSLSNPL